MSQAPKIRTGITDRDLFTKPATIGYLPRWVLISYVAFGIGGGFIFLFLGLWLAKAFLHEHEPAEFGWTIFWLALLAIDCISLLRLGSNYRRFRSRRSL